MRSNQFTFVRVIPSKEFSPVQFLDVVGLLEEVSFQSMLKLSFWHGGRVQMSTFRFQHSTEWRPVWPERFAVGMQTCRKYAGPAPRIQLNARNAILNCIRWGTSRQCRTSWSTGVICYCSQSPYKPPIQTHGGQQQARWYQYICIHKLRKWLKSRRLIYVHAEHSKGSINASTTEPPIHYKHSTWRPLILQTDVTVYYKVMITFLHNDHYMPRVTKQRQPL